MRLPGERRLRNLPGACLAPLHLPADALTFARSLCPLSSLWMITVQSTPLSENASSLFAFTAPHSFPASLTSLSSSRVLPKHLVFCCWEIAVAPGLLLQKNNVLWATYSRPIYRSSFVLCLKGLHSSPGGKKYLGLLATTSVWLRELNTLVHQPARDWPPEEDEIILFFFKNKERKKET